MLVYDLEIEKAIAPIDERIEGIEYCEGFHDHENMGVSCIGAYDGYDGTYRVFMQDNFADFRRLVKRKIDNKQLLIGFNNIAFDNAVLRANHIVDIPDENCYDILVKVWNAIGLKPPYFAVTHSGYGLSALCKAMFGIEKSGNGADAPIWYQTLQFGKLIDYCLRDVALTKKLFDSIDQGDGIVNPKTEKYLYLEV